MGLKKVAVIRKASEIEWVGDGLPLRHSINPGRDRIILNPFILLDYIDCYKFEPRIRPIGTDYHPRRGFEAVTFDFQGELTHSDSTGQTDTIYPGDVRWMTIGSGLSHHEKHSDEFTKKGGTLEILHLWINLPAAHKMVRPHYNGFTKENIPHVEVDGGSIDVIAGEYKGTKGPAVPYTPMYVWSIKLKPGATIKLPSPKSWVTIVFVRNGSGTSLEKTLSPCDMAVYGGSGNRVKISTKHGIELVYLSGEPLEEPIKSMGPMVMNTPQELFEAFDRHRDGSFPGMKGPHTYGWDGIDTVTFD